MSDETYTQVAADSTGDKIRTREASILQSDSESRITVSMQVVNLADDDGNIIGAVEAPIFVRNPRSEYLLEELIGEIRKLRIMIELAQGNALND